MGNSWHEFQARGSLEDAIATHGLLATYAAIDAARQAIWCRDPECMHKLEVPVVGQVYGSEAIEQLWSRARIAGLIGSGRVLQFHFADVEPPTSDRDAVENLRRLTAAVGDRPLEIELWSSTGGADDDGRIRWTVPLQVVRPADEHRTELVMLAPGSAPLEVGYTLPSRTMTHLTYDGAVWRWPYGAAGLWLLIAIEQRGEHASMRSLNNDFDFDMNEESSPRVDAD